MTRIANRMQEAVNRLAGHMGSHAAVTITYTQGTTTIAGLVATVGRTPYDVMDGEVMTAYESRDYIVKASDLGLTPISGDTITEANSRVYVVSIPKGMNVYESIGPDGSVLKIHTKG